MPLPVFVRFHYVLPTVGHPLTLLHVRERYLRNVMDSALVIWRVSGSQRFGFRAGIDEFACRTEDFERFELAFTRPAKGPGCIRLCTSRETIFSADRFSDDLLAWLRHIGAVLGQMFPNTVVEKDCG